MSASPWNGRGSTSTTSGAPTRRWRVAGLILALLVGTVAVLGWRLKGFDASAFATHLVFATTARPPLPEAAAGVRQLAAFHAGEGPCHWEVLTQPPDLEELDRIAAELVAAGLDKAVLGEISRRAALEEDRTHGPVSDDELVAMSVLFHPRRFPKTLHARLHLVDLRAAHARVVESGHEVREELDTSKGRDFTPLEPIWKAHRAHLRPAVLPIFAARFRRASLGPQLKSLAALVEAEAVRSGELPSYDWFTALPGVGDVRRSEDRPRYVPDERRIEAVMTGDAASDGRFEVVSESFDVPPNVRTE